MNHQKYLNTVENNSKTTEMHSENKHSFNESLIVSKEKQEKYKKEYETSKMFLKKILPKYIRIMSKVYNFKNHTIKCGQSVDKGKINTLNRYLRFFILCNNLQSSKARHQSLMPCFIKCNVYFQIVSFCFNRINHAFTKFFMVHSCT